MKFDEHFIRHEDTGVIEARVKGGKEQYNIQYVKERYDSYGVSVTQISHLRLAYLLGCLWQFPKSILDVGYGNGDFLKTAKKMGIEPYGFEVNNYQLEAITTYKSGYEAFKYSYDVISFFDSLEHFEDINFVQDLRAEYIIISVPYCHIELGEDWFFNKYRHLRMGEHNYHFTPMSLIKFMRKMGFYMVNISVGLEDVIRTRYDKELPNIITAVFKKHVKNS